MRNMSDKMINQLYVAHILPSTSFHMDFVQTTGPPSNLLQSHTHSVTVLRPATLATTHPLAKPTVVALCIFFDGTHSKIRAQICGVEIFLMMSIPTSLSITRT